MKTFFFNPKYTIGAGFIFFMLALIDILIREPKGDPNNWMNTWEYMSLFGKVDAIICTALLIWTILITLIKSKWK